MNSPGADSNGPGSVNNFPDAGMMLKRDFRSSLIR